jgi:hypothetical protein
MAQADGEHSSYIAVEELYLELLDISNLPFLLPGTKK